MSFYDDDGDYIIYEDAGSHGSEDGDSGEYSYPEDENDLAFVHHEDDEDDEDDSDQEALDEAGINEDDDVEAEEEEEEEEEEEVSNSFQGDQDNVLEYYDVEQEVNGRGSGNGRSSRISFLQDIVSRLANGQSDDSNNDGSLGRSLPDLLSELGRSEGLFAAGRGNSRYHKLIENVIQAEDDPYIAMESLRELSEQLLMINPLIADRILPSTKLMDALIHVLSSPLLQDELELQLIACRCLYNFYEMNPEMIEVSVNRNIVDILKEKLTQISYIDLAEQVLETLEFISRVDGLSILRSGVLLSCLQYLDFFTVHAQKKSLSIVANSCARAEASDDEMISEIFPILKTIFINNTNPTILKPTLVTLYSVAGSLKLDSLPALFDIEVVKRLLSLLSSVDMELDSILSILDIVSLLVSSNVDLSKQILVDCDLFSVIQSIFQRYKKASTSTFAETLIYVPKPLLLSVTMFILLLLPTEDAQVLTDNIPKVFTFNQNDEQYFKLIEQLIACLVDIYSNTVDAKIRYAVVVALTRIFSSLPHGYSIAEASVLNLISSGLTHGCQLSKKELQSGNGAILAAMLSLISIMMSKNPDSYISKLRKEGIPDSLNSLSKHYDIEVPDKDSDVTEEPDVNDEDEELPFVTLFGSDVEEDEDDRDDYKMEYDEMNIPEHVRPHKIKISVFNHLSPSYLLKHISLFLSSLLESFSSDQDDIISELSEITSLVTMLKELDFEENSEKYWFRVWSDVKTTVFDNDVTISGFELISTGLIDAMAYVLDKDQYEHSCRKKMFIKAFDDKLMEFVSLLQNALSRTETFAILDAGIAGNNLPSSSLVKQMKIRLLYDSEQDMDSEHDNIPDSLKDITISMHCVASLKTLDDFLKHKIIQSEFLYSIIPNINRSAERADPTEIAKELENIQFDFSINGHALDRSSTVYSVIFKDTARQKKSTSTIWSQIPTFKYRKGIKKPEHNELYHLYPERAFNVNSLKPVDGILTILEYVLQSGLPASSFVNPKISAKLSRQLEEPLIVACGVLPSWVLDITRNYAFLFPFETRMNFLQNTSYGYGRLIQYWREKLTDSKNTSADNPLLQLGRLTRHKLRVSRDSLFLSGMKILEKYGSSPNVLEIEYKSEEGTGLGPTLEFFALMSKEFARKSLHIWTLKDDIADGPGEDFVSGLLFPRPLLVSEEDRILRLFENLGTLVARSMLDNRILDFRFNEVFFELLHRRCKGEPFNFHEYEYCIDLIKKIDLQLGKSLTYLLDRKGDERIRELDLYFTLPGYDIELVEDGSNVLVEAHNLEEYLIRIFEQLLGQGINKQLDAFMKGFSKSFPYSSLLILMPHELSDLFGGVEEDWSVQTLYECLNADHGYSMDSTSITDLIDILSQFSKQERRIFLQFITGSPKLPLGGFKNLKPKFTVVLKHPEGESSPDHCLPSVMTCANYLKLPKYSSRAILQQRIVQAMTEGSGAFLLS